MELKQLELFLAIADSGAFSRAAMKLAMGQPALSRQIRALELELGVELYHRTGRGIVLTEAGKTLAERARHIVEATSAAQREVSQLGSSPTGSVILGMPPSVGVAMSVPIVSTFCERYPRISLGVIEGFSAHVLEWLLAGRIDVAVLYDAPRIHSLLPEPLLTDELFLLGPAQDPEGPGPGKQSASILGELPMIMPSRPHGLRVLIDDFLARIDVKVNVQLEIDAMPSTLRLIENGLRYYTVLSYSCVHDMVVAGKIRYWRLVEPNMTRSLVLATTTQRPVTKAMRALSAVVREQVHDVVDKGHWMPHD